MAVLTDEARTEIWADLMRVWSQTETSVDVMKADLRAAVDGVYAGLQNCIPAIYAGIPQPALDGLTPKQKARLLLAVAEKLYEMEQ